METIEQLETKLAEAKANKELNEWNEYKDKCREYLNSMIGKSYMRMYQGSTFTMFKVIGFKESYDVTRSGFYGQWSAARFFELTISKSISTHYTIDGRAHSNELTFDDLIFNVFKRRKKKTTFETQPITFRDNKNGTEMFWSNENDYTFGIESYNGIKNPDFQREFNSFKHYMREIPNSMFEAAEAIAIDNAMKTKSFWDEYESTIKNIK